MEKKRRIGKKSAKSISHMTPSAEVQLHFHFQPPSEFSQTHSRVLGGKEKKIHRSLK